MGPHTRGRGGNFQILVFGPFTPQIEEWRGRDLSSFFGSEKLQIFILALFKKTVIGPFFEARSGPGPGPGARAPHPPNSKFPNLAPNGPGTPKIGFLVSVS